MPSRKRRTRPSSSSDDSTQQQSRTATSSKRGRVQSRTRNRSTSKERTGSDGSDVKRRRRNDDDDADISSEELHKDVEETSESQRQKGKTVMTTLRQFQERYLDLVRSVYFARAVEKIERRTSKDKKQDDESDDNEENDTENRVKVAIETTLSPVKNGPLDYPLPDAGFLSSELRVTNPFETWAPLEIAIFEACMQCWGKKFSRISDLIKTKTTRQVIEFYYVWKKTSHYAKWKEEFEFLL